MAMTLVMLMLLQIVRKCQLFLVEGQTSWGIVTLCSTRESFKMKNNAAYTCKRIAHCGAECVCGMAFKAPQLTLYNLLAPKTN